MICSRHTLFTAGLTLIVAAAFAAESQAGCRSGSCGSSRGRYSYGHHQPIRHYQPVYRHPEPVYVQPAPVIQPIPEPQPQPLPQPQPVTTLPQQTVAPQPTQITPGLNSAPTTPQSISAAPAESSTSQNSAAMSALQALGGFAPPADQPTPQISAQPPVSGRVGTWSASLPNGARVQLILQADGMFRWSATNSSGNASTFDGSWSEASGSLTLLRSSDNQQLAGQLSSLAADSFSFTLSGQNAASLNFVRS